MQLKGKFLYLAMGLCLALAVIIPRATAATETSYLDRLRHWTAPDHTRLVFDLQNIPPYRVSGEGGKRYLIVELKDTKSRLRQKEVEIGDGLVEKVSLKYKDRHTLGVVIKLQQPGAVDVFTLKKFRHKPERLVIDVLRKALKPAAPQEEKAAAEGRKGGARIVLVDPGHGGEDPGAIGRYLKLEEKKVVLNIARRLFYELKKIPGIEPRLSRNGDYYLSLRKRTELAEKYKADLMISIHANSSTSSKLRGSSVYYLSPGGASDKFAELVAQKENAADLIGGVSLSEDKTLNAILIDMMQTSTINDSLKLGKFVQKGLKKIKQVPADKKLHSAPFAVLKSPATPSVLVEAAFISNRREERLLADPWFHKIVAGRLAEAIKDYLDQTDHSKALEVRKNRSGPRYHIVKEGDTLWRIARRYGLSTQKIRRANGMGRSNLLRTGQKLLIP